MPSLILGASPDYFEFHEILSNVVLGLISDIHRIDTFSERLSSGDRINRHETEHMCKIC